MDKPVGELLQALPLVKGSPVVANMGTDGTAKLRVEIQIPGTLSSTSPLYDETSTPLREVTLAASNVIELDLARLGINVPAFKIDSLAVAHHAAGNPTDNRLATATAELLSWLNYYLARGTGSEMPVASFKGIWELANSLGRTTTGAGVAAVDDAVKVVTTGIKPRGRGAAGEGPHCLIGNDRMLRSLMTTDVGTNGASGWRFDPRTGLIVYHHFGLPYYRADLADSSTDKGYLLAANLGPSGLNLVHGYGNAESYGVQTDEESTVSSQAQQSFAVHGAWSLVAWDKYAIYGAYEVAYTSA